MPHYETSVEIAAPVHEVWTVTRDIESWPDWSPTVDSVTRVESAPIAPVAPGSTARVRQPKLRPATWVVDDVTEDRNFTWHTSGLSYRITAVHLFEPKGDSTSARLEVHITGAASRLLGMLVGRLTRSYVEQEAAALKQHCEARQ
jgi:uncharacterized membrane protein